MSIRRYSFTAELFAEMMKSGRKCFSVVENPMPDDAHLFGVFISSSLRNVIHLLVASESFPKSAFNDPIPEAPAPVIRDERLFWSSQKPTTPGVYFLKDPVKGVVNVVEVHSFLGDTSIYGIGYEDETILPADALWAGPLDSDNLVEYHKPVDVPLTRE